MQNANIEVEKTANAVKTANANLDNTVKKTFGTNLTLKQKNTIIDKVSPIVKGSDNNYSLLKDADKVSPIVKGSDNNYSLLKDADKVSRNTKDEIWRRNREENVKKMRANESRKAEIRKEEAIIKAEEAKNKKQKYELQKKTEDELYRKMGEESNKRTENELYRKADEEARLKIADEFYRKMGEESNKRIKEELYRKADEEAKKKREDDEEPIRAEEAVNVATKESEIADSLLTEIELKLLKANDDVVQARLL